MKRNTLFSFLTVAALGLLVAGPASATTFTWDGSTSNDWRVSANWDLDNDSYPQSGDIAIIANVATDPVIDQQNEVVGELRISSGGLLTITGKMLTLDGTTAHSFRGDLVLSDNAAVLKISDSVTVSGAGNIIGQDNGAKIQIVGGKTLTSNITVKGQLTVETNGGSGNGTFLNGSSGKVRADADGTAKDKAILLVAAGLTLSDASGASWEATTDPDAVLQFDVGANCLLGNFVIKDCATIQLNGVSIDTRGSYTNLGGKLDLVGAVHFGHSCDAGCNNCTTISSDDCVTGAPSCSCP